MNNLDSSIWLVIPCGWEYNEKYYEPKGFSLPLEAYTIKEMAEESLFQKSIDDFKSIATNPSLSGYYNPANLNARFSSLSRQEVEEFYEKWWMIDREDFFISGENLASMSDEQILSLMEELCLRFYFICPTKIHC